MSVLRVLLFIFTTLSIAQSVFGEDHLQSRPRYHLRSGDSLTLDYRFTPEFNQAVIIQPDGFASLSVIGDLKLAGLTLTQAHDLIVQRASSRLNGPELNISLKEFEAPYIAVSGEVEKPGRISFYENTTTLQAILLAGGFKESARRSQVVVFRKVDETLSKVIQLDLHNVRNSKDLEHDLILEPGDIVFIPRNKLQNVARFVKSVNLGLYLDPLNYVAH